jgi:hypothetical protein
VRCCFNSAFSSGGIGNILFSLISFFPFYPRFYVLLYPGCTQEESWSYAPPEEEVEITTVGIGLDGTCMLICEDGYREAMVGTVSLYDREGERQHTIYLGAAPEYGKKKKEFSNKIGKRN